MSETAGPSGPTAPRRPPPLVVATSLLAVQGAISVIIGVLEVLHVQTARATMGVTTALFFVAYGALLLWTAWDLYRLRGRLQGLALLAQLLWLGVAWSFRGGNTTYVAIGLALSAVVSIAGLVHPETLAALGKTSADQGPDRP